MSCGRNALLIRLYKSYEAYINHIYYVVDYLTIKIIIIFIT